MKDKPFYYQDNRALHERKMNEAARLEISRRNIEFILEHQKDSAAELAADREGIARRYAKAWNAVVVLKGARTVVASPDGRVCVNPTGNSGLARGGSGDVLAGMTSALLACGLPAFDAAACAVYLHGAAADRAAALHGETGMLPHDLLDALGTLFAENGR